MVEGKNLKLSLYKTMVTIRQFEERVSDLYARGLIPGLAHLYTGEEAVAAGVCACLTEKDYITSTHRGHGHVIAKGAKLNEMMAELYGKRTGYCKGKGGSMHIADMKLGILGANGIAGGGLPIALGGAWAAHWRRTDQVAVCFFGDNAANNGTFHESLNLSSLKQLPVIWVCENNGYGISNPFPQQTIIGDVAKRASSYSMPGVVGDGNDVLEVMQITQEAVERARKGGGPSLLEFKTYRYRGHHEGDPNQGERYRSRDEIAEWRAAKDPIDRLVKILLQDKTVTKTELQTIDDEVKAQIDACVEFAGQSEYPSLAELHTDVYVSEV
jgi:pyruvate dehydrogenase E1 component alpha subunit